MKSSGLGIAEVVEATAALRPNAAGTEAIVRMCGLDLVPLKRDAGPSQATQPDDVDEDEPEISGQSASQPQTQTLPASVRRLEPVRSVSRTTTPADPLTSTSPSTARTPPSFEGLLTVRDGIELLRMAASVHVSADKLDIARITQHLAYAKPLTELPRLRVPSLALGAQILVDVGQSMQPFYEDQQDLVQRFVRNLRSLAEIRYFADDPAAGCGPERRKSSWKKVYELPLPQVPVIALTDLGCGYPRRPDAIRAWLRLAAQLRRRQSRVVIFAAVRLTRVPDELRRAVDLVLWDRSAVRRNVMQLAGAGDE